jgi:hypothetical protein
MNIFHTLAFSIATAAMAVAEPQKAIDPDTIKEKVSIRLGQEFHIQFAADGDRLLHPKNIERAGDDKGTVGIKLDVTDSTPFPVRGVATRPFLVVSNGFERTLNYRALARLKGSKQFFEVDWAGGPAAPGEHSTRCWMSGSLVEEVVLYQFALAPKGSK